MDNDKTVIEIPGMLKSIASDGILADSKQILHDRITEDRKQSEINDDFIATKGALQAERDRIDELTDNVVEAINNLSDVPAGEGGLNYGKILSALTQLGTVSTALAKIAEQLSGTYGNIDPHAGVDREFCITVTRTFEVPGADDSRKIRFIMPGLLSTDDYEYCEWSIDKENWTRVANVDNEMITLETSNLTIDDKVYFKGKGTATGTADCYAYFDSDTGMELSVSGDITKLIDNNTLLPYAFNQLFSGLTTLTDASDLLLPSTVASHCYDSMFYGCTSLGKAPDLPAIVLADNCYKNLFYGCSQLDAVKIMATDTAAENCLTGWLNGVAATGTITKNFDLISLVSNSPDGIPEGWSTVNMDIISIGQYTPGLKFRLVSESTMDEMLATRATEPDTIYFVMEND